MHAPRIIGTITVRVQSRADQRATLSDELEQGKATALSRLTCLVVDVPRNSESDDVEESNGSGVDCDIAHKVGEMEGLGQGENGVTQGGSDGVEDDGDGAGAQAVRHVRCEEDDDEGDEVRWCGKSLRG